MTDWEAVIGLEVHVQLDTRSKAFSPSAVAFGEPPNSLTDPTVLGLPGSLPVFNQRALDFALRLGLAVGSTIRPSSRFARKQYFYPDLPKGYQISQYDEPICDGGAIELWLGGQVRTVALTRIHLEEDAGKSIHHGATSGVDLNRAGTPLCEVVSEPVLRSAEEAAEYMRALRQLVRYLGISAGNMEQGHLRCDANVSLRPRGSTTLGTRAELKNINSFRFVQRAIEHEITRQRRILDGGGVVVQETRLWDSDAGTSHSMRSKEEANDYRYFPDPDLPPMEVDAATVERVRAALPELPMARLRRLIEAGLSADDARTLTAERELADYYDGAARLYAGDPRQVGNWILSEVLRAVGDASELPACRVSPARLAALLALIDDGTLSGTLAKKVFGTMLETGEEPAAVVQAQGLAQISDTGALETIIATIIAANPAQAEQYRAGKTKLMSFFVGQVMKATRGQANPQAVSDILGRLLAS
jgi:aspartyl-tRNA(Asn)/glutamyl-tRNA(Gln) amidotransferase subunit B